MTPANPSHGPMVAASASARAGINGAQKTLAVRRARAERYPCSPTTAATRGRGQPPVTCGVQLSRADHRIEDRAGGEAGVFEEGGELLAEIGAPLPGIERDERTGRPHCSLAFPVSTIRDQLASCACSAARPAAVISWRRQSSLSAGGSGRVRPAVSEPCKVPGPRWSRPAAGCPVMAYPCLGPRSATAARAPRAPEPGQPSPDRVLVSPYVASYGVVTTRRPARACPGDRVPCQSTLLSSGL